MLKAVCGLYWSIKQGINKLVDLFETPRPATTKALGGLIYASTGKQINFQPKGTDTVPAMLTPGEVVINKRASERYLPLLDSINRSTGGAALIPQRLNTGGIVLPVNNGASGMSTEDLIAAFNQLPTPVVTVAAINRAQRNNVEVRQTATL